jgi:hypothetical protein
MMPADLKRFHKYMLEVEHIDHISDEMRAVVESEWPELAHKLLPEGRITSRVSTLELDHHGPQRDPMEGWPA